MLPRVAERLQGDGASVDATNVNLTSGEIRPIRRPSRVHVPAGTPPWLTVHRAEWNGAHKWLSWTRDVDVARAPLRESADARYYWSGDGEPRYATFNTLPAGFFALGVPKPQAAAGVAHSGGSGAAVSRFYVYTFFSALGEEGPESPVSAFVTGKVDGTWMITGMDAVPASSGAGTAVHAAGVTTFTNTGNHWLRVGDEVVIAGSTVAVSDASSAGVFKVPGDFSAATAWARKAAWNTAGMKRRLYRSSGSGGKFQLVNDDVGTSYNDVLSDIQIMGDELISQAWEPPPPALRGLISLPNGAMVGFMDRQLCFSEPYQPHAWPLAFRRATDFEIVGIESFGTSVVACTKGQPYVAQGTEPASVAVDSVDKVWPCLSKRSVVSIGDGVLFATTHGMAYVGMAGASVWTEAFFSREEWNPLNPATMVAAAVDGKVFVRYDGPGGDRGILVFAPAESSMGLTRLNLVPDELYADPSNGRLYLVDLDGVHLFDEMAGPRLPYSWRSKEYHLPTPTNFGAAKVDFVGEMSAADYAQAMQEYADAVAFNQALLPNYAGFGGVGGAGLGAGYLNGSNLNPASEPEINSLTFTLYCDGRAVYARKLVADQAAFKLPAGFRTANVAVGLTGSVRVKSVKVAESMQGLKAL